jgi:hypothetical protein
LKPAAPEEATGMDQPLANMTTIAADASTARARQSDEKW